VALSPDDARSARGLGDSHTAADQDGIPNPESVLVRAGRENFPVASRLVPRRVGRHLMALYGFFRLVDYAGDEAPGDRTALLDLLEVDLKRVYQGIPRVPLLRLVAPTVRECGIPCELLTRAIAANRQEQHVRRYETFSDLLDYCSLSANPVGESVLHVFGRASPELIALSDKICTALQIVEHCQDLAGDFRQDRIYLPLEDMKRFGCDEEDLRRYTASTRLRGLVRFEIDRARRLLDEGAPLVRRLSGSARVAVAGYIAGGRATCHAFAAAGYDPLRFDVRPSRVRTFGEWIRLWILGGWR
jgi:squalene synthase HpnC